MKTCYPRPLDERDIKWWMGLDLNQQCAKAEDLQSPGVTNFPTHPLIESSTLYAYPQHALLELTVY